MFLCASISLSFFLQYNFFVCCLHALRLHRGLSTLVLSLYIHLISLYTVEPPQVTVHPADQINLAPGSDVSFSVTATGTAPLSYQWQKYGVDLPDGGSITGATTDTLTITGVMEIDEGGYRCVVSNAVGKENSNAAVLTVGTRKFENCCHRTTC